MELLLSKSKQKSGHLLLQFLDGLLSELSAGLGLLQLGAQGLDLLLVGLLPLVGLLLGNLGVCLCCLKSAEKNTNVKVKSPPET